jgi:hypothetical protein
MNKKYLYIIMNKKIKFNYCSDPSENTPGHYLLKQRKSQIIDDETYLLTPPITSKDKMELALNSTISPNNYEVNYSDNLKKDSDLDTYFPTKFIGAGRGFGNLNIANDIRSGNASRKDFKEFKEIKEGEQMFDYQFQYLTRNIQDPNHIVMPIPRGGESTRKQNQLPVNNMRHHKIIFDY